MEDVRLVFFCFSVIASTEISFMFSVNYTVYCKHWTIPLYTLCDETKGSECNISFLEGKTCCVAMVVCILFVTCRYDKSNKIRLPINITVVLPFQVSLSVITNDYKSIVLY